MTIMYRNISHLSRINPQNKSISFPNSPADPPQEKFPRAIIDECFPLSSSLSLVTTLLLKTGFLRQKVFLFLHYGRITCIHFFHISTISSATCRSLFGHHLHILIFILHHHHHHSAISLKTKMELWKDLRLVQIVH